MKKFKRIGIVAAIILLFLALGILVELVWDKIDETSHRKEHEDTVLLYSEKYNIPPELILAVIKVESNFDPSAESSAGALGLMQMMPSTFEWLTGEEHLNEQLPTSALYKPEVSIRYGTYYLRYLYDKFDQSWDVALAAYNGGEGNVAKWLADPEYSDGNGNLTYIPFDETRSYVQKVNKARDAYEKLYK